MTRSRYRIFEHQYPYFMTWTIVGWLPVFTRHETVEIILDSWRFLQRERSFRLFGYVILESHLHLIASAPELEKVIRTQNRLPLAGSLTYWSAERRKSCLSNCAFISSPTKPNAIIKSGRKEAIQSKFKAIR